MLQIREDIRSERRQSSSRHPDLVKLRVQVRVSASPASQRGHQLPPGGEGVWQRPTREDCQAGSQEICQVNLVNNMDKPLLLKITWTLNQVHEMQYSQLIRGTP